MNVFFRLFINFEIDAMSNLINPMESPDYQTDKQSKKENDSPVELNISIDTNNNNNNESLSEQYTKSSNEEFYEIIKSQSEEIKSLLDQRAGIMSLFQKFDNLNSKSDDIIESLTQKVADLNQQKTEIQNELTKLKDSNQTKKENANDIYYLLLKKAPCEVLQKIDGNKYSQTQSSSYQEIIDLFEEICNQYSISKKSKQREMVLLGHLRNALLFVNNIISSNSLQQTNENKTLIMTQIARINHFIGENYEVDDLKPVISLFQQNKPEDQIKTIFSFLDKHDVEEEEETKDSQINEDDSIPFNELYTLFYGVIEVNNLLFSQLDLVNENVFNTASGISLKKKVYELEEENHKLSDWYDQANSKLESIINVLSKTSIEQTGDALDMVSDLVQKYNSIDQQKSINSENEGSKFNFSDDSLEYQSTLNNNNSNNQNQSPKFYKTQQKVAQRAIAILCSQNQENEDKINYSKAMIQKLKKTIAQEKKKFSDYEKTSNAQINKLKSELIRIKKENQKKKDQDETMAIEHQNLIKQNKKLLASNKKLVEQNKKLKTQEQEDDSLQMKLRSIKLENEKVQYSQIQTQTNEQDPDDTNTKLQEQISSLQNECSELQSNISALTKSKNDIVSQNIKLKVSEKSLKLKISQMEEYIRYKDDQSKTQSQIREISINTQKDLKIKELNNQIKNYEFLLKNFAETYFPSIEISKETKYEEIISQLQQALMNSNLFFSQETLKDANEIRKQLNLKKTDSILDSFIQIKNQLDDQSKTLKQLNDEKISISDEIKEARSNVDKMIKYKSKLDEWNKWAVSIYTQISGVISSSFSPADIRHALEEILMSAIGHRTLLGKLDILRFEKIYLTKFDGKISNSIKPQKNSKISIKPLIFILLFTRKIQKLTSCLSISYIPFVINQPRTKKENSLSLESSLL